MLICKIGGYKIVIVKNKIIKTSIKVKIDNAKNVPTKALPSWIGNANNNLNNSGVVIIEWIDDSIGLVIESKIVKVLIGIGVDNTEEILIGALLSKIENINNVVVSWRPKE